MRVISVISGKGGVGKTTVASNLGVIASMKHGANVIMADCNMTASHLGVSLGVDHYHATLNHVLNGSAHVNEAVYAHSSGARVLPASSALKDLDGVDISLLPDVVKRVARFGRFDVMILDCAPGLGRDVMAAINASDEVVLVASPCLTSVMDAVKCMHVSDRPGCRVAGMVANMLGMHSHELSVKEMEGAVGVPAIGRIPMDKNVLKSMMWRTPVFMMSPSSKASKGLEKLADALFG